MPAPIPVSPVTNPSPISSLTSTFSVPRNVSSTLEKATLHFVEKVKPKWNGKANTWQDVWKEWELNWNLKQETVTEGDKHKCYAFVECILEDEKN